MLCIALHIVKMEIAVAKSVKAKPGFNDKDREIDNCAHYLPACCFSPGVANFWKGLHSKFLQTLCCKVHVDEARYRFEDKDCEIVN